MSLLLTIVSTFECEWKVSYFILSSFSIFLSTNTNIVANLYPLNSVNNFFSLFLIADLVSLSYSSGLKKSKILTL